VLEQHFGRYGLCLTELARGIDDNEVIPDRPTQSISVEDTFERDVPLTETEPMIRRLAEKLWSASRKESRITCCFFASLKTLLIPTKATALHRNQRPRASFSLAGFQVTLIGRFWVTAEAAISLRQFRPWPLLPQPTGALNF
jgi:nucleotidyltransferase/DNA polymerase involved in DNA repair